MRIHVLVEGKSEEILISKWGPLAFPNHQVIRSNPGTWVTLVSGHMGDTRE